jgi:phosphohistidine swiveling domain-containing protein
MTPATITSMSAAVALADACDQSRCGGKASNLCRLIHAGAPVPEGVVITNGDAVESGTFAGELWPQLQFPTAIVRSSAVGEDSAGASFAGQLDSIAGVTSAASLRDAIERVWASQRSERVLAYQAARGVTLAGMGIIVQRQVTAALSGVLFTQSPVDRRQMLLEYCGGMGEALVSGAVNPGRVALDRRVPTGDVTGWSLLAAPEEPVDHEALLLNDARMTEVARLALTIEATFGSPQDIEWTIDHGGKLWIVQSRPITAAPWKETQATPTLRAHSGDARVRWSNANVNENFPQPISPLLYSLARQGYYHYFRNLGRAFGVSAVRLRQMEPAFRQVIGVHGARMYYNLTSIHSVLRSVPVGDLLAGSFNQFVGAEDTAARSLGQGFRLKQGAEVLVIAAKTFWQYLFVTSRVRRFESVVDAYAERTQPAALAERSLPGLLADFRTFMDIRCNQWNDAALADAGAMVCYGVLQRLLARSFPHRDQQALHNSLLKALPDLVSGIPPLKLWELSRLVRNDKDLFALFQWATGAVILDEVQTNPQFCAFRRALERFLEDWGYRCSGELMLTVPTFQEEPAPVIELLKAYVSRDGDAPADLLARQAEERLRETREVLDALRSRPMSRFVPFLRHSHVVGTVLKWTQTCIQLRERARLKQALLYSRLRRVVLQIGERLESAGLIASRDDLFYLSTEELDLLAAGGEMLPHHVQEVVALRRRAHAETTRTTPPDSIDLAPGEYLPLDDRPSGSPKGLHYDDATGGSPEGLHYERPAGSPQALHYDSTAILRGVGACGGTATARAAVLLDVTESRRLDPGDVLVTKQTDPGWGPIFPLISGLVIERGGMLSHGAIIAREFGIPSVVGVKNATRLIAHGSSITVDGDRGVVHVRERE